MDMRVSRQKNRKASTARMTTVRMATALLLVLLLVSASFISGCSLIKTASESGGESGSDAGSAQGSSTAASTEISTDTSTAKIDNSGAVDLSAIPEWKGSPSVEINENEPGFTEAEITEAKEQGTVEESGLSRSLPDEQQPTDGISDVEAAGEEKLAPIDDLGRCGAASACIGRETMPDGERESIGMIRPSGWPEHLADAKYDFIDGEFLYNRCHLIGWQLTGENADERNLITGTRYMNAEGMLPFENEVASYVKSTGNHVLYRVTPAFDGDELVARGVQMEALSVEDGGEGVSFNVFCYNVQPRVEIDYMTGENHLSESMTGTEGGEGQEAEGGASDAEPADEKPADDEEEAAGEEEVYTYVLNTNTMKFHYEYCPGVRDMKDKNKDTFRGTRSEVMEKGYSPCGRCTP